MNKSNLISELYSETVKKIVSSPQAWKSFLRTACRNYKLEIDEQILLYAQKPNATAILTVEQWNRFGRIVKQDADVISLVRKDKFQSYFDISDTLETEYSRPVPLWEMRKEYEKDVIERISKSFGAEKIHTDLAVTVAKAISELTVLSFSENKHNLKELFREIDFLDSNGNENFSAYNKMLKNSTSYAVLTRLNINADEIFPDNTFKDIVLFQNENLIMEALLPDETYNEKIPHNFDLSSNPIEEVGKKERFRRNIEAIKTLKACELEGRLARPVEQITLSKYVGWGGMPEAFDERNEAWKDEFLELKSTLSVPEYESANDSVLSAFYTPTEVVSAVYEIMERLGFKEGNILEPSCGVGNFIGMLPPNMQNSKRVYEVKNGEIFIKGKSYPIALDDGYYIIRKLTVKECCRLQTLPDDYCKFVSKTQGYKGLGNGWTAEVIIHILLGALKNVDRNEKIVVLSMYDGIGTGRYCLDKMGFKNVEYYAFEIDKFAMRVANDNYPDIIQCGDAFQMRDNVFNIHRLISGAAL